MRNKYMYTAFTMGVTVALRSVKNNFRRATDLQLRLAMALTIEKQERIFASLSLTHHWVNSKLQIKEFKTED